MSATTTLFDPFIQSIASSALPDFSAATLKLLLLTSTWTPNASLDHRDDLTSEVANGAGYATGGETLTGVTVTFDGSGHFVYIDADDVTWGGLNRTFQYGVLYQSVGSAATDVLIAYINFGGTQTPAGGAFVVQWAAPASGGVLRFGS